MRPEGAPHSAWELLEHIRLAQQDILRFSQSAEWESPKFPDGYWPTSPAPPSESDWLASVESYRKDLAEFEGMILDTANDLFVPFAWGDGQTLFREAIVLVDHLSYHLGQLVLVKELVAGR